MWPCKRFPAAPTASIGCPDGILIDDLDIECDRYQPAPELLTTRPGDTVEETLYSHLLKSNCLVTGQPDWAMVVIRYRGRPIDRAGLLRYIVSFRNHNEFHEQCVERIFMRPAAPVPAAGAGCTRPLHPPWRARHQPLPQHRRIPGAPDNTREIRQ